ncbi:hypothetical protein [Azospirillum doebereinerae]
MLTVHDQIRELRAELAGCFLTGRERAQAEVDLGWLMSALIDDASAFTTLPLVDVPPD